MFTSWLEVFDNKGYLEAVLYSAESATGENHFRAEIRYDLLTAGVVLPESTEKVFEYDVSRI